MLVDVLTDQIHTHRGADGRDIPGAQQGYDAFQRIQHDLLVDDDLGVVGVQVVGNLLGVFQVDGVLAHTDGKGADGLAQLFGGDGAHQAGIQTAGQKKAHGGIGVQPLIDTGHQLFADVCQNLRQLVSAESGGVGNVAVANKFAVAVVAADGERINFPAQPHQVFSLGSKGDAAAFAVAVEQRADADGVARGNDQLFAAVIQNHGKLGVKMAEHIQPVLVIQRQNDFAVRVGGEGVALFFQLCLDRTETVQLTVADYAILAAEKRLHSLRCKPHDGQTTKAEPAELGLFDALVVGTAACGAQQIFGEFFFGQIMPDIAHNTAHR